MKKSVAACFFLLACAMIKTAQAEEVQKIILTWKASTYTPPSYALKSLPVTGSLITVSAQRVTNNKLFEDKSSEYSWFVNGELRDREVGMNRFTFQTLGQSIEEQVTVKIRNNEIADEQSIVIHITKPEVVIQKTKEGQKDSSSNRKITLSAIPFFFTISSLKDLNFSWNIDGNLLKAGEDNQLNFDIQNLKRVGKENRIGIEARIRNVRELAQSAKSVIWIDLNNLNTL